MYDLSVTVEAIGRIELVNQLIFSITKTLIPIIIKRFCC